MPTTKSNQSSNRVVETCKQLPTDLLTVSDVARLLRCSRKTVERLVARGELPFYELPLRRAALRFAERDISEWLSSRRHEADTEE